MAFLNNVKELPPIKSKIVRYRSIGEYGDHVAVVEFEDGSEIYFHYSINNDGELFIKEGEFNPEDYLDEKTKMERRIKELEDEVKELKNRPRIVIDPDRWPCPDDSLGGTRPFPNPWKDPYKPYPPYPEPWITCGGTLTW